MKSIKTRLTSSSLIPVIIALAVAALLFLFFSNFMIDRLLTRSDQISSSYFQSFKKASNFSSEQIIELYKKQAKVKGKRLVAKDSMSLRTPFLDNQILFIQEFVTETLKLDDDIVYAGFYTIDSEQVRAIKIANLQSPNGLSSDMTLNRKDSTWYSRSKQPVYNDIGLTNIIDVSEPTLKEITYKYADSDGNIKESKAIEVAAPIFEGYADEIPELLEDGESIGFIRYIISLERTASLVDQAQTYYKSLLDQEMASNEKSKEDMKELGQNLQTTLYIALASASILIVLLSYFVARYVANKISKPIVELNQSATEIAAGRYDVCVHLPQSSDEIGQLSNSFEDMRIKVKTFTENLQSLVDKKTAELRFLLDNIDIAIFKIESDFRFGNEYSAAARNLFGELKDKDTKELFRQLNAERTADIVETLMDSCELTFEANANLLPLQLNNDSCDFELTYSPYYDEEKNIDSILVSVRDVTAINKLKSLASEEAKKGKFILSIATHGAENIRTFIRNEIKLLGEHSDDKKILRNLHTAKGNSLAYGFHSIADQIHSFESELASCEASERTKLGIKLSEKTVQLYHALEKTVNSYFPSTDSLGLSSSANLYLSAISQFPLDNIHIRELYQLLYEKCYVRLPILISKLHHQLSNFSGRLHKPVPVITAPSDLWIKRDIEYKLQGCINHIIRNSLDHGIEYPDQRAKLGKPDHGTISFEYSRRAGEIEIRIFDDGRGLSLKKIAHKRKMNSNTILCDVANAIFEPGFTTKESVTDISGRGVGMDAVKCDIEEIGGSMEVFLTEVDGEVVTLAELEEDYLPFCLLLCLPEAYIGRSSLETSAAA